jgi:hypothetical protein
MKITPVEFNGGIQFPPKLGTIILKPTSKGKASYAQNIDVSNDEYGNSAVVPGPSLTTIGNNSVLTGTPTTRQFFSEGVTPTGYLYFSQGAAVKRIKDVLSGSTPTIDTSFTNGEIGHNNHDNQEIVDMVYRPAMGDFYIYVSLKDDTDVVLYKFRANSTNPTPELVPDAINTNVTQGLTRPFLVYSAVNGYLYWIYRQSVDSLDMYDNLTKDALALGLPVNTYATCGTEWQKNLLVAYTNEPYGDFDRRKSGGHAGIAIWDFYDPKVINNILAPCRFISALINSPDGNVLVFGGIDEGKSSIYEFTGYGFRLLTQYIGDMPKSRHSVEFDAQGRVLWLTMEGHLCRFDKLTGVFEHLGSIGL